MRGGGGGSGGGGEGGGDGGGDGEEGGGGEEGAGEGGGEGGGGGEEEGGGGGDGDGGVQGEEPRAEGGGGGAGGGGVAAVARLRRRGGRARVGASPRRVVREARQGHTLSSPLSLSLHLHFGSVHFLLSSLISNLEHWNGENLEQCGLRIPPFGFLFLVENIN